MCVFLCLCLLLFSFDLCACVYVCVVFLCLLLLAFALSGEKFFTFAVFVFDLKLCLSNNFRTHLFFVFWMSTYFFIWNEFLHCKNHQNLVKCISCAFFFSSKEIRGNSGLFLNFVSWFLHWKMSQGPPLTPSPPSPNLRCTCLPKNRHVHCKLGEGGGGDM